MSSNNRHDRDWWVSTVENLRSSKLNLKEFAESVAVHPDTLGWWRRKLAREPAVPAPVAAATLIIFMTLIVPGAHWPRQELDELAERARAWLAAHLPA